MKRDDRRSGVHQGLGQGPSVVVSVVMTGQAGGQGGVRNVPATGDAAVAADDGGGVLRGMERLFLLVWAQPRSMRHRDALTYSGCAIVVAGGVNVAGVDKLRKILHAR